MPFIRGRYHINPIMGEALEAARAAEGERLAAGQDSRDAGDSANDQADGFASPHATAHGEPGPIHRIEIEATEIVPAHSGRASRGYVARVHRLPAGGANHTSVVIPRSAATRNPSSDFEREIPRPTAGARDDNAQTGHTPPETHVFADHRDLVNFLRDELAKEGLPGRR